jgi:hypothetical protein
MDKNTHNVMKKLEAKGEKVARGVNNPLNVTQNERSNQIKKLETFFKSAEDTFKAETGRPMTYSEMRAMFG